MKEELLIQRIKKRVSEGLFSHFSGLGIIIVDTINYLPISPLLSEMGELFTHRNENEIVDFLFEISNYEDKRHDGFHIVSLDQGLLKISQYFSPPIPKNYDNTIFDVGARYRTAQFGSLCKNISLIIVVGQSGVISVAKKGFVETLNK